jgi:NAD+ kinase
VRLCNRENYTVEDVEWAESVFSAGGDGNFLWAASKVLSPNRLVVGLNTDPNSSEGYLCLNSSVYGSLLETLWAVFRGEVSHYQRVRIRVEVDGQSLPVPALNEVFIGEKNPSQ